MFYTQRIDSRYILSSIKIYQLGVLKAKNRFRLNKKFVYVLMFMLRLIMSESFFSWARIATLATAKSQKLRKSFAYSSQVTGTKRYKGIYSINHHQLIQLPPVAVLI